MDTSPWREPDAPFDFYDSEVLAAELWGRGEWLRDSGVSAEVAQRFAFFSLYRARDAAVDALKLGGWKAQADQLASSSEPAAIHDTVLRMQPPIVKAASKAFRRVKKGGQILDDHAGLTGGVEMALVMTRAADLQGDPYVNAASAGIAPPSQHGIQESSVSTRLSLRTVVLM